MRVHINGRLPLIKNSVVEFSNGDEVSATFVYERLERHCSKCYKLDHEIGDCLEAKHQKKALQAAQKDEPKPQASLAIYSEERREPNIRSSQPQRREDYSRPSQGEKLTRYTSGKHSRNSSLSRNGNRAMQHGERPLFKKEWQPREHQHKESYKHGTKRPYEPSRGDSHPYYEPDNRHVRQRMSREDEQHTPLNQHSSAQEITSSSRNKQLPSARGVPLLRCESTLPPEAIEAAASDIRKAMAQYTMCADPTESAARQERFRQAENHGEIEETAIQMVRAAIIRDNSKDFLESPIEPTPEERLPVSARLGPLNSDPMSGERVPLSARLGPVNGEPLSGERGPLAGRLGPTNLDLADGEPEEVMEEGEGSARLPATARLGPALEGVTTTEDPSVGKKRKPGRPLGSKKAGSNVAPPQDTENRKKKAQQGKPPTGRKAAGQEGAKPRRVTKAAKNRRATPRPSRNASVVEDCFAMIAGSVKTRKQKRSSRTHGEGPKMLQLATSYPQRVALSRLGTRLNSGIVRELSNRGKGSWIQH
ncbi:Clat_adaptor_s domain-containing protein [Raphanus sativus]|nr:Clat_adaptor_s domain-containing protein [Raphanus sativus]